MNAKEDIVKYVTTTPHNINPVILNQKLDEFSAGGGGNNNDTVKYVEQILTNEEKMQARKNLGLYYRQDFPKNIGSYYSGILSLENWPSTDRLVTEVTSYNFETKEQESSFYIPMAGEDFVRWYGNGNLIPPKAISQNIEIKEKIYPNLPYVVYYSMAELSSIEEGIGIAFDEEALAEMGIDIRYNEFYFYNLNDLEYHYETIPQEYLPPVIVKDRNGNNYHLVVNDDGSLSVEPA